MPDNGEMGHVLTAKVGPLPLVLWVAGGASVIFIVMMMRNKGNSGASGVTTNQVSALAPTEAEAFGTIEQQQQDVTNALTTLGNNQSALGGSMSTLTGIVTQQGSDNAAAFQNLVNGQNTIEAGQTSAANASDSYYNSLLNNLTNYFNSLGSQISGVNSNVTAVGQQNAGLANNLSGQIGTVNSNLANALAALTGQISGVSGQVGQVSSQQQADALAQQYGFQNTDALLAYLFYQIPNRYQWQFPASPTSSQNTNATAQNAYG